MGSMTELRGAVSAIVAIVVLAGGAAPGAAQETFTATASVKAPTAAASAPITLHVERFVSDADRDKIMAVVKKNDGAATRAALAAMPDIGYMELGKRRTAIKYAYARTTGGGRLITIVTAQPVLYLGGSAPDAKPKAGFDLAMALLTVDSANKGEGELAPAVKIKINDAGAIVTDEYGAEVVRLLGVTKSK